MLYLRSLSHKVHWQLSRGILYCYKTLNLLFYISFLDMMHLCKLILAALISKSFNAKMRNTIAMLTWVNKLEYVIDKRGWLVLTQKNSLALQVNWPSTFTSRSYGTIYIGTLLVYFWKALTIPFLKCFPYTFHLFLYCVIPGYISIFSIKVLVPIDIFWV